MRLRGIALACAVAVSSLALFAMGASAFFHPSPGRTLPGDHPRAGAHHRRRIGHRLRSARMPPRRGHGRQDREAPPSRPRRPWVHPRGHHNHRCRRRLPVPAHRQHRGKQRRVACALARRGERQQKHPCRSPGDAGRAAGRHPDPDGSRQQSHVHRQSHPGGHRRTGGVAAPECAHRQRVAPDRLRRRGSRGRVFDPPHLPRPRRRQPARAGAQPGSQRPRNVEPAHL